MAKPNADIQPKDEVKTPIIRKRSFRDILEAGQKRVATGHEDDGKPIKEEVKEEPKEEVVEEKEEKPEKHEKATEDIIAETAEKTRKAVLEEIEAKEKDKQEKTRAEEEKRAKAAEESKVRTPAWEDEKRTPKTYTEIYEEARKAAVEESNRNFQKMMEERDNKAAEERKANDEKVANEQKSKAEYTKNLEKQIGDEIEELRAIKKLPTIKNDKDENDEGKKALNDFMTFGTDFNNKRMAEGKMPLFPMGLMNYYTPKTTQPAGADAPIAGNTTPAEVDEDAPLFTYAERHNMSFRELAKRAVEKISGKK
jgi:hypothetical protein